MCAWGETLARWGNNAFHYASFCFEGKICNVMRSQRVCVCVHVCVCGFAGYPSFQGLAVGVQLSLSLPCPPTGTDGHPRSSLISLQSGSGPALPRCGGPCFKTPCQMQSPPSACPLIVLGEAGERESATSHNTACVAGYWAHCVFLAILLFFLFVFCCYCFFFPPSASLSLPSWAEGGIAGGPWGDPRPLWHQPLEKRCGSSMEKLKPRHQAGAHAYACWQRREREKKGKILCGQESHKQACTF